MKNGLKYEFEAKLDLAKQKTFAFRYFTSRHMSDTCYKSQSENLTKKEDSFAKVVKYCLEKTNSH